jgi:hypothetical protein
MKQMSIKIQFPEVPNGPERFNNMYLRLGGMHALMRFVGAIGSSLAESGLFDILSADFGGVPKMPMCKKFPQNVCTIQG